MIRLCKKPQENQHNYQHLTFTMPTGVLHMKCVFYEVELSTTEPVVALFVPCAIRMKVNAQTCVLLWMSRLLIISPVLNVHDIA